MCPPKPKRPRTPPPTPPQAEPARSTADQGVTDRPRSSISMNSQSERGLGGTVLTSGQGATGFDDAGGQATLLGQSNATRRVKRAA